MMADQILHGIDNLHSKEPYIAMPSGTISTWPTGKSYIVLLINFAFANEYCDPPTREQIPYGDDKKPSGNAHSASITVRVGVE